MDFGGGGHHQQLENGPPSSSAAAALAPRRVSVHAGTAATGPLVPRKQLSLPANTNRSPPTAYSSEQSGARSGSLHTTPVKPGASGPSQQEIMRCRAATVATSLAPPARLIRGDSGDEESCGSSSVESVSLDAEDFFCMMPNGVSETIRLHLDDDVYQAKEHVVKFVRESDELPLRGTLRADWKKYSVSYITQEGFRETAADEKTLRELKPFKNILKFGYVPEGQATNNFKRLLGELIGKDLREYHKIQNCEVNDFRWKMKTFANNLAQGRRKRLEECWQARICYQYPPRLMTSSLQCLSPEFVETGVFDRDNSTFRISIEWSSHRGGRKEVDVHFDQTADGLILDLGAKLGFNPARCCFKAVGEDSYLIGPNKLIEFVYVYEHLRMGQAPNLFIVREDSVEVESVEGSIYVKLDKVATSSRDVSKLPSATACAPVVSSSQVTQPLCIFVESLRLPPDCLPASSSSATANASSAANATLIGIKLGLYHGAKRLSPTVVHYFKHSQAMDAQKVFRFEIPVANLPRMAKLCVGVFEKKKNNTQHPLFWVNAYVFDYRSTLRWRDTLHMWRYSMGDAMPTHEHALSPLRHAIANPDLKSGPAEIIITFGPFKSAAESDEGGERCLTPATVAGSSCTDSIDFHCPLTPVKAADPSEGGGVAAAAFQQKIEFREKARPGCVDDDTDEDVGSDGGGEDTSSSSSSSCRSSRSSTSSHHHYVSKFYAQELSKIAERDPLNDITVQEKDLIWKVREHCCSEMPHLLPRIIDCVNYSDADQVSELHSLLERWPLLRVEGALQLLDYAYPDQKVRRYAVNCLRRHASDQDVLVYLLQLAQALKHEPYLFSDLVEFLLERALNNQHIGHYLFWQLRSEMNKCSAVSLLNGLVLETYLEAAPEHCQLLRHQITLLDKCRSTAMSIHKLELVTKDYNRAQHRFAAAVKNHFFSQYRQPFGNFVNPLNPNQKCRRIRQSRCKLMNSKTRPQMLAFENAESRRGRGGGPLLPHSPPPASSSNCVESSDGGDGSDADRAMVTIAPVPKDTITMMYKKGDDLRQDILTLQLVTVMDRLWKDAGLDLRMKVYRCIATARTEGLIDVVSEAETICKIQMSSADSATAAILKKGVLSSWLKSHNQGVQALALAQEQFTLSCAGYTVAAYVLGIGDRHNDNIMVKTNGQMFHIDFGHILGNYKHKFGIKRERVPLVLSSEFTDVISTDDMGRCGKRNFNRFRNMCERAYLTLRRHSSLLISLLAMMISTGLPELSSEQDLNIIRSTLNLDQNEEEALESFKRDFDESLRNDWKITANWWFHMSNQTRTAKTAHASNNTSRA